jgi:hypothetical protein
VNAIHARSQLRYSPKLVDLEIREIPYETAVMLTRPSRDSQEKGTGRADQPLVFAERAVENSPRSTCAVNDGLDLPLKMRGDNGTKHKLTITVLDNH